MTIRWDEDARRLSLSVRDLAEDSERKFGFSAIPMARRAQLGRVEHELQQSAREQEKESYRRELAVSWTFPRDDITVHVQGRMDGVYLQDDVLIIEEIKTVLTDEEGLAELNAHNYPSYIRQLQLYQLLVEQGSWTWNDEEHSYRCIDLHLLMVALPERQTRVIPIDFDSDDCLGFVHSRLTEIIARIEAGAKQRARRKGMADKLRFPFKRPRMFQRDLMRGIRDALREEKDVLVSAATGSGKTVGSLLPALKKALTLGGQVFVATSKTTQQQIFMNTLEMLARDDLPLHGVVLTAREKVCQNDVVLCHPERCEYIKDYDKKMEEFEVLEGLRKLPVVNAQSFISESQRTGACPFFMAFDSLGDADVIIGDYNYVFDPGATVRQLFVDEQPSDLVLIVDEAHNLVDRGAGYYSPELSRRLLEEFEEVTRLQGDDALLRRMRRLVRELDDHLAALERGLDPKALREEQEAEEREDEAPEEEEKGGNLLLFDDPQLSAKEEKKRSKARKKREKRPRPGVTAPVVMREELSWVPMERCVEPDKSFFEGIRNRYEDAVVSYFIDQARGRRPVMEEDPVIRVHRALSRLVTVLEMFDESFSAIYRRSNIPGEGALKILCKDPSGPLGQRISACAATIAISATLAPFDFYRALLGFPEDAERLDFGSPFPLENRRVLVDTRMTTRYKNRRDEMPLIAEAIRTVASAREGNVIVCFPSYSYMEQVALRIGDIPIDIIMQTPGMSDLERQAVLDRLAVFDPENARRFPPLLLFTVQGGVFTEGVDYPGELCTTVVLVGPALPKLCFERRLIQAYFEKKYKRGFDFAYLYPGMNRVIQAAGRVHRTETDKGIIVLLGSRFLEPAYARLLPYHWYERSPRELRSRNLKRDIKSFWEGHQALELSASEPVDP